MSLNGRMCESGLLQKQVDDLVLCAKHCCVSENDLRVKIENMLAFNWDSSDVRELLESRLFPIIQELRHLNSQMSSVIQNLDVNVADIRKDLDTLTMQVVYAPPEITLNELPPEMI